MSRTRFSLSRSYSRWVVCNSNSVIFRSSVRKFRRRTSRRHRKKRPEPKAQGEQLLSVVPPGFGRAAPTLKRPVTGASAGPYFSLHGRSSGTTFHDSGGRLAPCGASLDPGRAYTPSHPRCIHITVLVYPGRRKMSRKTALLFGFAQAPGRYRSRSSCSTAALNQVSAPPVFRPCEARAGRAVLSSRAIPEAPRLHLERPFIS